MAYRPGLSGRAAKADADWSSRRPAFTFALSGPWQVKHLSDSTGFTCRLKSTFPLIFRYSSSTSFGSDGSPLRTAAMIIHATTGANSIPIRLILIAF